MRAITAPARYSPTIRLPSNASVATMSTPPSVASGVREPRRRPTAAARSAQRFPRLPRQRSMSRKLAEHFRAPVQRSKQSAAAGRGERVDDVGPSWTVIRIPLSHFAHKGHRSRPFRDQRPTKWSDHCPAGVRPQAQTRTSDGDRRASGIRISVRSQRGRALGCRFGWLRQHEIATPRSAEAGHAPSGHSNMSIVTAASS